MVIRGEGSSKGFIIKRFLQLVVRSYRFLLRVVLSKLRDTRESDPKGASSSSNKFQFIIE